MIDPSDDEPQQTMLIALKRIMDVIPGATASTYAPYVSIDLSITIRVAINDIVFYLHIIFLSFFYL